MTKDEAQQLFRNVFCNVEGEEVLEILKEELGYTSRTSLAEDDRRQCYRAGRADAVRFILDMIDYKNIKKSRKAKNVRRNK